MQGLTLTPGFGEGTEFTDGFSGAGMVDTVAGLVKAAQDQDSASIAAFSVGLAFDVVGAALNPLGAVLGAGVGWLIDHIFFLREPLDLLIGDNIAIRQETEKLKEDAAGYEGLASGHLDALRKLDGWTGEAAERFRATMSHVAKELEAIGSAVNASAKLMGTMGAVVTAVRSLVRDIIAMVIGNLIGGALVAMGLAPITLGASVVAFVGTAVATALEALARIMGHIAKLKSLLTSSSKAADDLGTALTNMSDDAARFTRGGGSSSVSTPPPLRGNGDTPSINGGGGAGGPRPPAADVPPVQRPPEVPGGSGAGAPRPPAGDVPTTQRPPEVPATGGKGDTPEPPPVQRPPADGTNTATVTPPAVKPPDSPTVPKPQEVPSSPPPGGGAGGATPPGTGGAPRPSTPPPGAPNTPATPKPDDAAPKPSTGDPNAPKPPVGESAAPKPPGSDTPGPGGAGGTKPLSWGEAKNHIEDLGKYGKQHLESVLTTKFGKTPEEAADISRWIKNFEELAAPGGHLTVAGRAFATGSMLHLVHELWKELGADRHGQQENSGFLGDLREYNSQQ
ncbi:hypothetical protein [Lentzea cavernae]|uniref:hypothetical protein n=1 Tax=Lentzea cavernae TaxID=2020703 RepID=UPI001E558B91|nr:hypothetical protein [Lentzea cavernae]